MRTINLTADARRHLERVTEWLEAGAPHRGSVAGFDLSSYVKEGPRGCGTVCCIAGAIAQFDREDKGLPPLEPWSYQAEHAEDDARRLLGLTSRESTYLFCGYFSTIVLEVVTPAEAGAALRRLLITGKLDWEPVLDAAARRL